MLLDGQEERACCPAGHALNPQESASVTRRPSIFTDSLHIYRSSVSNFGQNLWSLWKICNRMGSSREEIIYSDIQIKFKGVSRLFKGFSQPDQISRGQLD